VALVIELGLALVEEGVLAGVLLFDGALPADPVVLLGVEGLLLLVEGRASGDEVVLPFVEAVLLLIGGEGAPAEFGGLGFMPVLHLLPLLFPAGALRVEVLLLPVDLLALLLYVPAGFFEAMFAEGEVGELRVMFALDVAELVQLLLDGGEDARDLIGGAGGRGDRFGNRGGTGVGLRRGVNGGGVVGHDDGLR